MQLLLLVNGKIVQKELALLVEDYSRRICCYFSFEIETIPDPLKAECRKEPSFRKAYEEEQIFKRLKPTDKVLLLDEKGPLKTSRQLAQALEKMQLTGAKRWVWIVGGPYGFSPNIYNKFHEHLSLSPLTFTHDMVRLIAVEQIYRAATILSGHPYHHD